MNDFQRSHDFTLFNSGTNSKVRWKKWTGGFRRSGPEKL